MNSEKNIKEYWTTFRKKGVNYFIVRENISKDWWQQINLKLYILILKLPSNKIKESPFNKIATLSNTLRDRFWLYWKPRTHLAVNKIII